MEEYRPERENTRILLVDDMVSSKMLVRERLGDFGYKKIEETCGEENRIKELVQDYRPHLILMDTDLGGQTGYEICRKLRSEDYGKSVAIIGMSWDDHRSVWLISGADEFIQKKQIVSEQADLDTKIQDVIMRNLPSLTLSEHVEDTPDSKTDKA